MRRAASWYPGVLAGVSLIITGLMVDAWRHSAGAASEESLLSPDNPGHLIAAIGLGIATVSALIGLTLGWWEQIGWPEPQAVDLLRRLAVPAACWIGVGGLSVGAAAYVASADIVVGHGSHDGGTSTVAAEAPTTLGTTAATAGQAALSTGGVDTHSQHEIGRHPTFGQFMSMEDAALVTLAPADALQESEVPQLREQLRQVRAVAEKYRDADAALADGYYNTTHDVPFMGAHFVSSRYLADGVFDPSKPEGLLYSRLGDPDGPWQLVGVWFLLLPGSGGATMEMEPEGFAGSLDYWHGHEGLCTTGSEQSIRENASAEECVAAGGRYIADLRWMAHVWVLPEVANNDNGVFAYLNENLFAMQTRGSAAQGDTSSK